MEDKEVINKLGKKGQDEGCVGYTRKRKFRGKKK